MGTFVRLVFEVLVQTLHVIFPALFVARRGLDRAGADLLACRLFSRLAYVYWFHRGKIHCMWSHLREMNLAERYPPTAELAQAYSEHAPVMTMLPWFSRGIAYAARSLAIREDRGDVWGQGQSLNFYGVALYASARFDECIERCGASVRLLARAGDRWEENTARWNIALAQYRKGELGQAVATARAVHRAATELGDRQAAAIALGVWAKASGGRVPGDLVDAALAQPVEDIHAYAEVMQAHALRLLRERRFADAVEALARADRRVTAAGLKQEYVAPIVPWLATALRLELEATPAIAHARRVVLLRRARQAARRALRIAREYPNNLPQALRELGLLAAVAGEEARAAVHLRRSAEVAARQGARYEHALTLAALGRVGAGAGWASAAADAEEGARLLRGLEAELEPAAPADGRPGTLALADRFATLVESGRSIAAALSADALYARVADAAVALLRGERGLVLHVDAGGGISPPEPGDAQTAAVLAPLARRAIVAGGPATSGPAQDELLGLAGIESALCAPIHARGRVAACFCAIHTGVADLFGEDDKRLAQFVATLAGAALENAEGLAELAIANREREEGLRALNDAHTQLAVAGRMATVGTLAAGVAHEINNPLQYVIANLSVVGDELDAVAGTLAEVGPPARLLGASLATMRGAIVDASDGAARVRQIVRDLRTFTHDADVRTPVDVRRVLDSVVSMGRAEIHHRARLVRAYEDVPRVLANEARVGQVFLNVLLNAAQAIPEGHSERNEIRLVTRAAGADVIIEVSDTGSGIPPHLVERVFDPFFTTKPVGQGMGLGLSICHGIVTGLGGSIEIDSVVGKGTTMRIALPAMEDSDAAPASQPTAPSAHATPRGFVVVIDDEPLVSEAISGLIGREHEVAVAHDGARGIDLVASLTVEVDVILCDVMMPRMTGSDVYAELRRRCPGMEDKLVFMTGDAVNAAAREFLQSVPNPCLDKPIDAAALREHIRARVAARVARK